MKLRPEAGFLIALARGDEAECRTLSRRSLEAERLLRMAAKHQVAPLCWTTWGTRALEARLTLWNLPPAFWQGLRVAHLHHRLCNQRLARDIIRLDRRLREDGVDVYYTKGPWVAFRAYPEPASRPVGDIDMVVPEQSFGMAAAALVSLGYAPHSRLDAYQSGKALSAAHYRGQVRFVRRGSFPVEVHFRLLNIGPPEKEEKWVWESTRWVELDEDRIRVPGPEAMLLHLSIHAAQHGFSALRLLHDLRWALRADAEKIDPGLLARLAGRFHCKALVHTALTLSVELAGARPGSELLASLRPPVLHRVLLESLWGVRAVRTLERKRIRTRWEAPLLFLSGMGTPVEKLRYAGGILSVNFARVIGRLVQLAGWRKQKSARISPRVQSSGAGRSS